MVGAWFSPMKWRLECGEALVIFYQVPEGSPYVTGVSTTVGLIRFDGQVACADSCQGFRSGGLVIQAGEKPFEDPLASHLPLSLSVVALSDRS